MLANRSMPRSTVIPELPYSNISEAVDWLCRTFGFTLRIRIGDHRAQLNVGDGAVVLIERPPQTRGATYAGSVMVRIDDVHGHHERSRQSGAHILRAPQDYPYGERQYSVEDLGGHRWNFSQSIADVDPRDWGGTPGEL
jgi:uncharacterized glyoxalase superfamily protein PhnB